MLGRRPIKGRIIILIIVVLMLLFLGLVEHSLRNTIETIAEAQATWTATKAINTAVLEKVATNINYTDLIEPEKDYKNQVIFMQVNTMLVNKLKSGAELEIQSSLQQLEQRQISIPFGQILGIKLLSNLGPSIKMNLVPIGTVQIDVIDTFEAAGINQTRHRIYLAVQSKVKVVFPLMEAAVPVETKIPIADAIIVGPVPQFYFGDALFK